MVQNCPRCGTPNLSNHRYCSNCGAQILETPSSEASTPQEPGRAETPAVLQPAGREIPPIVDPQSASTRADLPPGLGERSGEATYVPYATDVVRELEQPKSNEKWLLPTILVAGGLLVVLVGVTIFLWLGNNSSNPGNGASNLNALSASTPIPGLTVLNEAMKLPCVLPSGATPEQEVMYTVCRSSEEQIKAWHDLDSEVLKGSRTGSDLQDNIAKVEQFKTDNQYADPVMHNLVITGLKLDKTEAIVKTAEVWSVTVYKKADNSVVEKSGPSSYAETYHLVNLNGKWYVDKVEFENLPRPGD